jgi:hypothetical protein
MATGVAVELVKQAMECVCPEHKDIPLASSLLRRAILELSPSLPEHSVLEQALGLLSRCSSSQELLCIWTGLGYLTVALSFEIETERVLGSLTQA